MNGSTSPVSPLAIVDQAPAPEASAWPGGTPSLTRRVNVAVLLTTATRVLQIAAGLITSIVTARFLAPEGRGEYFIVVTLARTLAQFGNLGLQSSNTYLVARDRSLLSGLVANSAWVSLLIGGGGAVLVLGTMFAGSAFWGPPPTMLWFAALLAPVTLFYALGTNLLAGINRFDRFNAFEIGSCVIVLLALLAAGAAGAGPSGFLIASIAGWTVAVAILFRTLRAEAPGPARFDTAVFRAGVRYSAKAYLATLAGFLLLRSNVFILNAMAGSTQVGYYSVATQFADVLAILPQSIALVLFPNLVSERAGRFGLTVRSLSVVAALLGAGCLVVAWLAEPLVTIGFGDRFLPAVPVLHALLPGVFFVGLTAVVSQYLAAVGFPRSVVIVWFVGFGVSTAVSVALIPRFSAVGAAIALSVTHVLVFVLIASLGWARHRRDGGAPDRTEGGPR